MSCTVVQGTSSGKSQTQRNKKDLNYKTYSSILRCLFSDAVKLNNNNINNNDDDDDDVNDIEQRTAFC